MTRSFSSASVAYERLHLGTIDGSVGFMKAEWTAVRGIKDRASIVSAWGCAGGMDTKGKTARRDSKVGFKRRLKGGEEDAQSGGAEDDALLQVKCPSVEFQSGKR